MSEPKPNPYAGQGGAYTFDPVTGETTQVEAPTIPPNSPEHPLNKKDAEQPSAPEQE